MRARPRSPPSPGRLRHPIEKPSRSYYLFNSIKAFLFKYIKQQLRTKHSNLTTNPTLIGHATPLLLFLQRKCTICNEALRQFLRGSFYMSLEMLKYYVNA